MLGFEEEGEEEEEGTVGGCSSRLGIWGSRADGTEVLPLALGAKALRGRYLLFLPIHKSSTWWLSPKCFLRSAERFCEA